MAAKMLKFVAVLRVWLLKMQLCMLVAVLAFTLVTAHDFLHYANGSFSVCDDGWSGASNIATLNADAQQLQGTLLVGDDSTLNLNLANGSAFEGAISGEITNAKGSVVSSEIGTVNVTLDETSTWTLTADTYITSFSGNAENVISNGYTLYVGESALEGTK